MKGIVFVELLSMAEALVGEEAVDTVIEGLDLPSGGAYTSVGNYPCSELMAIVGSFSEATGHSVAVLQNAFGKWIFQRFSEGYEEFFCGKADAFHMLSSIENEVHVEVRKIYPEAELPTFDTTQRDANTLCMTYASERPLVDFCQGMIEACLEHFNQSAEIVKDPFMADGKYGATFTIRLAAQQAA
ncbi:MAG: heme NO-binding domain-containing protein [Rhodobacteraceae bacterium]|nr:heme NO-binding domain-containing protein [Paracoccaceae bacterium]